MGPEGGFRGGEIVAQGTPEDLANEERSHTGQFLARMLAGNAPVPKTTKPVSKPVSKSVSKLVSKSVKKATKAKKPRAPRLKVEP